MDAPDLPLDEFNNLLAANTDDFTDELRRCIDKKYDAIIILDDDPTGTQTVYDVPVLTDWDTASITAELELGTKLFFILTNSRSLTVSEAIKLATEIGSNINNAAASLNKRTLIVSRSDSTLRGHYPEEVDALANSNSNNDQPLHVLIPAFFEGHRYTWRDTHFIVENEKIIPVANTPFAKDLDFGYKSSNLLDWVIEKHKAKLAMKDVSSIALGDLRNQSTKELAEILDKRDDKSCVINAINYNDLVKAAIAILNSNRPVVFRTAASFVAALHCKPKKALLERSDLELDRVDLSRKDNTEYSNKPGGLIIVGSHVPKTTSQLSHTLQHCETIQVEIDVSKLINGTHMSAAEVASKIDLALSASDDVVLYTSRTLISDLDQGSNLDIGKLVSAFLCDIVKLIAIRPKYILAKGGITSSDIATRGLSVKRAMIKGQVISGVPLWWLGAETKFPGLNFIVFPGNVGDEESVTYLINKYKN